MMRFIAVLFSLLILALPAAAAPRHVIVIAMENKDAEKTADRHHAYIYGNTADAPFINGELARRSARAANFRDELPDYPSEPHYVLMEAGRAEFPDASFTCDADPLDHCSFFLRWQNWTASPDHLVTQIEKAGLTWMTYQEGIDPHTTGACPIRSAGLYAAKHNPFVFFADVAGNPPAADNPNCIAHTRELGRFAADMKAGKLANYVFISPNLCHDMHGASGCGKNEIANGDSFLKSFLPPLLDWAEKNGAVVFVTWDEGKSQLAIPFYAAGAGVKQGYVSKARYSHRSMVKTVGRIFGLPVLDAVKDADDLGDLFEPGVLP